jgi:hypothetical protein
LSEVVQLAYANPRKERGLADSGGGITTKSRRHKEENLQEKTEKTEVTGDYRELSYESLFSPLSPVQKSFLCVLVSLW